MVLSNERTLKDERHKRTLCASMLCIMLAPWGWYLLISLIASGNVSHRLTDNGLQGTPLQERGGMLNLAIKKMVSYGFILLTGV